MLNKYMSVLRSVLFIAFGLLAMAVILFVLAYFQSIYQLKTVLFQFLR